MAENVSHYRIRFTNGGRLDLCAGNPEEAKRIAENEYPGRKILDVDLIATRPKLNRTKKGLSR